MFSQQQLGKLTLNLFSPLKKLLVNHSITSDYFALQVSQKSIRENFNCVFESDFLKKSLFMTEKIKVKVQWIT